MIMWKLFSTIVLLLALLLPSLSFAAPSITGSSGTYSHGNTITISGSGFGTKSPAAPLRWENWESGTLGQSVATGGYWSVPTTVVPTFSNDYLRHQFSSKSSKHSLSRGMGEFRNSSTFYKGGLNFGDDITGGKIFMSSWTRWKDPTVIDYGVQNACQIKFFRIDSTAPGADQPTIMNGNWYYPVNPPGTWYNMVREDLTYQHGLGHSKYNDSQWNNVAVQVYTGTRGNTDASIKNWDNGNQVNSISNALLYVNGYTKEFQMATFQFFMGNCTQAYTTMYTDDIYLDSTWARVEIGNASTYNGSSHREMLIPVTWGSSQITATFNQGSFANGSTAYIFVVDSDGNASTGRQITISGTYADASAPYASNYSPAKSSTGVLETNRVISFSLNDSTDVLTANGSVSIEGVAKTCAAGLTCDNTVSPATVSYTNGSDWSAGQVVNVSISGFRDSLGNIMDVDTWLYTVRSAQGALEISTPSPLDHGYLGEGPSITLSATGGTPPYAWSTTGGAWPTGQTLSTDGTVSGTPTMTGIFTANATVTDALEATASQDFQTTIFHQVPSSPSMLDVSYFYGTLY